jgi:hypothetical protein
MRLRLFGEVFADSTVVGDFKKRIKEHLSLCRVMLLLDFCVDLILESSS